VIATADSAASKLLIVVTILNWVDKFFCSEFNYHTFAARYRRWRRIFP